MADQYSARDFREQTSARNQFISGLAVNLRHDLEVLRVSAATVQIIHPVEGVVASPVPVLPTVEVTSTGVALDTSRFIPATGADTADLEVGRQYMFNAPGSPQTLVTITDVEAGVGVKVEAQLRHDFAAGAVIRDTQITVDAGILARARSYRARWTLTPESTAPTASPIVITRSFDVVLQPFELSVGFDDVVGLAPSFAQTLGDNWRKLLRGATSAILTKLDGAGLEPDRVFDTRPWTLPASYWIARQLLIDGRVNQRIDPAVFKDMNALFKEAVSDAFTAKRTWYDAEDTGVAADADEREPALFFTVDRAARIAAEEEST